jgi:hypothetical protein
MKILISLLLVSYAFNCLSQEAKETADTMVVHKVMLIPYDPRFYLSDADRDIMEQSNMDAAKFRSKFRYGIDRNVQRAISGSYKCISLLNDTADILEETMYATLGRTGYRYEKAIPITPKPMESLKDAVKIKGVNAREHEDSKTASMYIPVKKDAMYMHATVTKPAELFAELNKQFDTDIYVFLTQFEIKTNYQSCLDIANKIYKREVMVHFTIYDKTGKLLAGSYATSEFPSDSNNANKIIGDCFPEIAGYIAGCLP